MMNANLPSWHTLHHATITFKRKRNIQDNNLLNHCTSVCKCDSLMTWNNSVQEKMANWASYKRIALIDNKIWAMTCPYRQLNRFW